MLIFKDGTGYQELPEKSEKENFAVSEKVAVRIKAGEPWRLNQAADGVEFLTAAEIEAQALAEALASAEPQIDSKAREIRLCYVSPGKDATYQQKAAELARYEADNGASGPYPYIEAEATARDVTPATVAGEIAQARDIWSQIDPQIEARSRAGKLAARAAATAEAVNQAIADTLNNLEQLKP